MNANSKGNVATNELYASSDTRLPASSSPNFLTAAIGKLMTPCRCCQRSNRRTALSIGFGTD